MDNQPLTQQERNDRTWGVACHLAALGCFVLPYIGHVIGPLIVWLVKRNDSPIIDEQGKESFNFQLSMTLYGILLGILLWIIPLIAIATLAPKHGADVAAPVVVIAGMCVLAILAIADFVFVVIAAIQASKGQVYHYPVTIHFVR